MKKCFKCGEQKSSVLFSADKSRKDGLQPKCKSCCADYQKSRCHPRIPLNRTAEEKTEYFRLYRLKNKESLNQKSADWMLKNKEKFSIYAKKWKAENLEHTRQLQANYRVINAEKLRNKNREYRLANIPRLTEHLQNRNARKLNATPAWASREAMRKIYELSRILTSATGVIHHVDHIVPLRSPLVCGLHCEANLQCRTSVANMSKGNRFWPDMP